MDTTRHFTPNQYTNGLESWDFLKLKGKTPFLASAFGDVFFTARNGVWFLDTVGGTLERICRKEADLKGTLDSQAGREKYLMTELVLAAEDAGLVPVGDQVLDYTIAPALGGPVNVSNLSVLDFVVKLNVAGQIRGQIRRMKPGTLISGVSINEKA